MLPVALAGQPALELCNTFAGWDGPDGREYLADYEHLVVWAGDRGLIDRDAVRQLRAASGGDAVLARARRLRHALYRVLTGAATDAEWATIAREAQGAWQAARLTHSGGRARWTLPSTPELPLRAVAMAGAELLADPPRVGRCPGHDCGWLFVNPRGTRRWCSMAVCGNRAKVARHARRERGL